MPTNYTELYFPVLLQVVIAIVLAGGLVGASAVLGQRIKNRVKDSPYESGMIPTGSARERFSVKFYLVGMVFILFDIEAVFLYPWAVVYRELGREMRLFGFLEMFLFIVLVLAGFFYIWKKGVLNWAAEEPEGTTTAPDAALEMRGTGSDGDRRTGGRGDWHVDDDGNRGVEPVSAGRSPLESNAK